MCRLPNEPRRNFGRPTDVGGRKVGPCGMILQIKNGKFVRVSPTKKGTLDCSGGTKKVKVTFE